MAWTQTATPTTAAPRFPFSVSTSSAVTVAHLIPIDPPAPTPPKHALPPEPMTRPRNRRERRADRAKARRS